MSVGARVHFVNFVAFAGARLTKRTSEVRNVNAAAGERVMLTKCTRIVWVCTNRGPRLGAWCETHAEDGNSPTATRRRDDWGETHASRALTKAHGHPLPHPAQLTLNPSAAGR